MDGINSSSDDRNYWHPGASLSGNTHIITILLLQIALPQWSFLFGIRSTRLCKLVAVALTERLRCRCDKAGLRGFQCGDELFSLLDLLRQSREISIDSDEMNFIEKYIVDIL